LREKATLNHKTNIWYDRDGFSFATRPFWEIKGERSFSVQT